MKGRSSAVTAPWKTIEERFVVDHSLFVGHFGRGRSMGTASTRGSLTEPVGTRIDAVRQESLSISKMDTNAAGFAGQFAEDKVLVPNAGMVELRLMAGEHEAGHCRRGRSWLQRCRRSRYCLV